MPKEKSLNPAAAQRKLEKSRAIKKSKTQVAAQRNEKLARRNPERLQKSIDELKELETSSGGKLRAKDKQTLERLEKEVEAVRRARDRVGAPASASASASAFEARDGGRDGAGGENRRRGGYNRDGNNDSSNSLGKRRRGSNEAHSSSDKDDGEETDPDVRSIPMPKDTPPPPPRHHHHHHQRRPNANRTNNGNGEQEQEQAEEKKKHAELKVIYSAAPVLRDLGKEARRFVPAAVAQNIARQKGQGGRLLEPEEADRLERAGYRDAERAADEAGKEEGFATLAEGGAGVEGAAGTGVGAAGTARNGGLGRAALDDAAKAAEEAEKEAEFRLMAAEWEKDDTGTVNTEIVDKTLRRVEMEEVEDEDL